MCIYWPLANDPKHIKSQEYLTSGVHAIVISIIYSTFNHSCVKLRKDSDEHSCRLATELCSAVISLDVPEGEAEGS